MALLSVSDCQHHDMIAESIAVSHRTRASVGTELSCVAESPLMFRQRVTGPLALSAIIQPVLRNPAAMPFIEIRMPRRVFSS
jgi:hypothetical protein